MRGSSISSMNSSIHTPGGIINERSDYSESDEPERLPPRHHRVKTEEK